MLIIVMPIVNKNRQLSANAKFRSFFRSIIEVPSPRTKGANSDVRRRRAALTAKRMLTSWRVKGGSNKFYTSIRYSIILVFVSAVNVSFWIVIGLPETFANAHAKALAKMHPICS